MHREKAHSMPILDVEIVTPLGEQFRPTLAKELADTVGLILESRPVSTWVRIRTILAEQYAEGPGAGPAVFPVFVHVLKAALPDPDAMQPEVARLTSAVAELCGRPSQNVHILYQPEGRGRVAFGGKLVQE